MAAYHRRTPAHSSKLKMFKLQISNIIVAYEPLLVDFNCQLPQPGFSNLSGNVLFDLRHLPTVVQAKRLSMTQLLAAKDGKEPIKKMLPVKGGPLEAKRTSIRPLELPSIPRSIPSGRLLPLPFDETLIRLA